MRDGLAVVAEQFEQRGLVALVDGAQRGERAFGEPPFDGLFSQVHVGVDTEVDRAAGHPRAQPGPRIAQHEGAAARHVLEREALQIGPTGPVAPVVVERTARQPAEDQVGAGEANPGPTVGVTLYDERAGLSAVGERLPDGAVDEHPVVVRPLEHDDPSPVGALGRRVHGAAFDLDVEAVVDERPQPVARHAGSLHADRGPLEVLRKLVIRPGDASGEIRPHGPVAAADFIVDVFEHGMALLDRLFELQRDHPGEGRPRAFQDHLAVGVPFASFAPLFGQRMLVEQEIETEFVDATGLHEQIAASDEIPHVAEPERGHALPDFFAHLAVEADQPFDRPARIARGVALQARVEGGVLVFEVRRDAGMAGTGRTVAADRASDGDHRERPEADAVGAQADHAEHVLGRLLAAVGPEFDPVPESVFDEGVVAFLDPDFDGEADMLERVFARGPGAAVVAGNGDDVRPGLGDPGGDYADAGNAGQLDRNPGVGIDRLEFFDQLREIFDRVEIVVVARRNQVDTRIGVPRGRDLFGDLEAGQVTALAGLGALPDLDFDEAAAVEHPGIDPEAGRRDLLAAVAPVATHDVLNLAALAVHAGHVQLRGRLDERAERHFTLRAEAHGRDVERRGIAVDFETHLVGRDGVEVGLEFERVTECDGRLDLVLLDALHEGVVVLLALRHVAGELPHFRVEPVLDGRPGDPVFRGDFEAGPAHAFEIVEPPAARRVAEVVGRAHQVGDLMGQPERGEGLPVAAQFVRADRRNDLFDAALPGLE